MSEKEVFSPQQVYVGAFLGGPIAGVYLIKKNFESMLNQKAATLTLMCGSLAVIALTMLIFVLPENIPNMLIPLLYSGLAAGIAWHYQVSKEEAEVNPEYTFISNWSVAKIAVISFVLYAVLLVAFLFAFGALGIEI
jgi:hypothetical protein